MRVCGAISLLGCLFIVTTFTFSTRFRRPVNRLIFYASWGNIVLAIMSILSVDPIFDPYGPGSSLCTAQGFMIQMFLPSDALWNLAMAINVYLTIFKRWEVERMKRLEILYATFNFGAPFIIAIAYLFVNDSQRGRIYGPASIWCWISSEWEGLRIALLYAPSWICILVIFGIYVAAGLFIYEKRKGLHSARITPTSLTKKPMKFSMRRSFVPLYGNSSKSSSADADADPFKNATVTTEIKVTSERAPASVHELTDLSGSSKGSQDSDSLDGSSKHHPLTVHIPNEPTMPAKTYEPYSVTINGGKDRDDDEITDATRQDSMPVDEELGNLHDDDDFLDDELLSPTVPSRRLSFSRQFGRNSVVAATAGGTTTSSGARSRRGQAADAYQRRQTAMASRQQTRVAWSYTKVALLYFLSLLCTWVPSSVNRVFSLVHGAEVNYALSMAAAFVLPLVGFWNALIYMVTSWDAVRESWWEMVDWMSGQNRGSDKKEKPSASAMANVPRVGTDGRW